jgi:predicted GH43/DUF377 family glycosyl hydrolase
VFHLFCEEKKITQDFKFKIKSLISPGLRRILRELKSTEMKSPTAVKHAEERYFVQFTSDDIINWDVNSKRIVFKKSDDVNSFDSKGVFSPQVYYIDGTYYLFYGGSDGKKTRTGLATSNDLMKWERANFNPILEPGGKGDWDENNALIVGVLRVDDGYCAFYEGEDRYNKYRIGIAYSLDLKKWEKFLGNPIIDVGSKGSFNESMVCSPHIFMDDGRLFLYFSAHDRNMRGHCGIAYIEEK